MKKYPLQPLNKFLLFFRYKDKIQSLKWAEIYSLYEEGHANVLAIIDLIDELEEEGEEEVEEVVDELEEEVEDVVDEVEEIVDDTVAPPQEDEDDLSDMLDDAPTTPPNMYGEE